jgi:protein-tyrosine phosphatase
MDTQNQRDIAALDPSTTVRMFRDFDPARRRVGDRDVPDPYFGGDDGFDEVLTMVERTAEALVAALARTRQAEVDPAAREAGG